MCIGRGSRRIAVEYLLGGGGRFSRAQQTEMSLGTKLMMLATKTRERLCRQMTLKRGMKGWFSIPEDSGREDLMWWWWCVCCGREVCGME